MTQRAAADSGMLHALAAAREPRAAPPTGDDASRASRQGSGELIRCSARNRNPAPSSECAI